jgi:hypothetical protein
MIMRYSFALLFLLAAGCDRTGTATLTITRLGTPSFSVKDGATEYPITLTSGQLAISDVNLIDESAPAPTPLLVEPSVFDFVTSDTFFIDSQILRPKGFEQIHIFVEDAIAGPLAGSTLQLAGTVTLSNAQVVNLSVDLSLPRSSQEMLAAVSIRANRETALQVHFDPSILLGKIDFDGLGALGDITIEADSGDPLVDETIAIIIDNLLRSFGFDGPIGGDITG